MAVQRRVRGGQHLRMCGQAQIIVGAQIDDFAPLAVCAQGVDVRALRAAQHALLFEQTGLFDACQFVL